MTIPLWMLLAFASWTVLLLLCTAGFYRWRLILSGRASINEFRADRIEGAEWYCRSMRAHANCVENLPVFTVVVFALSASQLRGATISCLTVVLFFSRVVQSLVHVCFAQTQAVAALRFAFFSIQLVCLMVLTGLIVAHALSAV